MRGTIIVLAVFFFVTSLIELLYLQRRLETLPTISTREALKDLEGPIRNEQERLERAKWRTAAEFEKYAWSQRYFQANVLLSARLWTRYLSFVTGMILSMVGVTFVLGRLDASASKLNSEGGGLRIALETSSPGLILCVLGTILMTVSMLANPPINVDDGAIYLPGRPPSSISSTTDEDILRQLSSPTQGGKAPNAGITQTQGHP
jgi:hypothetical protein